MVAFRFKLKLEYISIIVKVQSERETIYNGKYFPSMWLLSL